MWNQNIALKSQLQDSHRHADWWYIKLTAQMRLQKRGARVTDCFLDKSVSEQKKEDTYTYNDNTSTCNDKKRPALFLVTHAKHKFSPSTLFELWNIVTPSSPSSLHAHMHQFPADEVCIYLVHIWF
jgi:hypothetical protein